MFGLRTDLSMIEALQLLFHDVFGSFVVGGILQRDVELVAFLSKLLYICIHYSYQDMIN
jgi:hypothetical protein